jgi:hypothetical protein
LSRIHVLHVHKVQHKPIKRFKLGTQFEIEQKELSVLKIGAPDCPVCHQTVSGAQGPYTLENSRAPSAIIHRTVRCGTGLSDEPAEQRLSTPTVDSDRRNSAAQYRAEVRAAKSEGHRTVRCRKRTKPPMVDQLQTLMIG